MMSDYERNQNLEDRELDWDDEIENTQSFTDIPDGEYNFVVDHFERAKVGGDGKYAGKNMAVIFCDVLGPDNTNVTIRTNLIMHSKFQWKLSQFFISIGLMKDEEGERLRMPWTQIGGCRGRCKVEHKPNYNDATKTHLEITEFLKPGAKTWAKGKF